MTVNHWVVGSSPTQGATGGVAEWLNAPVLKTGIRESVSRVRIPPPPPLTRLLMSKVLFLGTSHTQGECERGKSRFLNTEDCYVTHLSKLMNKEFVRLARGGVDNFELGVIFNSYREHFAQDFADVDTVIAEIRYGTEWVPFPAEQLGVPMFSNTDGIAYEVAQDFGGKESHINATQYPWNWHKQQLLDSIDKKEDKLILESMFPTMELYMRCAEVVTRNVYDMLMIYEICKLLDINFYWFTFTTGSIDFENKNNQAVINKLENEYADFYSKRLCENGIRSYLKDNGFDADWDKSTCECGHFDEHMQKPIAEFLYAQIQKQRTNSV